MDCAVAAEPVTVICPETPDIVAVMTAVPGPTMVTKPVELTVATAVLEEAQVTLLETLVVWLLLQVAVAPNWTVSPVGIELALALP